MRLILPLIVITFLALGCSGGSSGEKSKAVAPASENVDTTKFEEGELVSTEEEEDTQKVSLKRPPSPMEAIRSTL